MVTVRPASPADAPAIARLALEAHALHASALPGVFHPPSSSVIDDRAVEAMLARPEITVLVATDGDDVIGYAQCETQREPATAFKRPSALLHIHAMAVTGARRSGGVGRSLMAAVREEASRQGLAGVSLEVYAFNGAARAFYEREGFVGFRERMIAPPPSTGA